MKRLCFFLLLIIPLNNCCVAYPQKNTRHTDHSLHFGIFFHYLNGLQNSKAPWNQGKTTSWDECVNDLNVNRIADQVAQIGVDYVIITTEQIDKFMCLPNNTYESLTGYRRGEATSHRDVISELYYALHKKGIKLFLYVTGDGPRSDNKASLALNNPTSRATGNGSFKADKIWVDSWSRVIRSISLQYRKKIAGWWFDGSYGFIGYNNALLKNYLVAAKSGNSSALVAFNFTGPRDAVTIDCIGDYTAGESNKFENLPGTEFRKTKVKWHILSFLGNAWAQPGVRYSVDYLSSYIRKVKAKNGMVTIDVCLLRDGTIDPEQFNFLKRCRKYPSVNSY